MNCGTSESPPSQGKNRPFICPCGKSYLSYPALFTHIKQKHSGKPPGDVVRPKSQNRRGRPRKLAADELPEENERPEFKSLACRLLFNHQQEKELGYLINQVEIAKERYRASLDFAPPITSSHLSLALPPNNHPNTQSSPSPAHQALTAELRGVIGQIQTSSQWAGQTELEELISLNVPYLLSLEGERRSSRRPIGSDIFEMELRSAILQFLDSLKRSLSRLQFRNVEVLLALLIYFFTRELQGEEQATTTNYVQHLNTFAARFLLPIAEIGPYNKVFSLTGDRPTKILVILHKWLTLEKLTDYVVELKESARKESHEAQLHEPKPQQNE